MNSKSARTGQWLCHCSEHIYFCLSLAALSWQKMQEKLPGIVLFLVTNISFHKLSKDVQFVRISDFINCFHTDLKYFAGRGTNYNNVLSVKTWWNQASSDLAFWQSPNYFPGAHITQPPQKQFWEKPGQTLNQWLLGFDHLPQGNWILIQVLGYACF